MMRLMECKQCKSPLASGEQFCTRCGAAVQNSVASKRCNFCTPTWNHLLMLLGLILLVVAVVQNGMILSKMHQWEGEEASMAAHGNMENAAPSSSPHNFNATEDERWASPMAPMVFSALTDPCGKCDISVLKDFCAKGKGQAALQELINSLFTQGKDIRGVFDFFVKSCGINILNEQAKAIYAKNHPEIGQ